MNTSSKARTSSRAQKSSRRWPRRVAITLAVVVAVLLLLQLLISPIAKAIVNRKLAAMPDYTGHLDSLQIALWKAGVDAGGFVLKGREHQDDPPVVSVKRVNARFSWSALLHGRLGGEMFVEGAESTIVKREQLGAEGAAEKAKEKAEKAKRQVRPWRDALRDLFPIELTRLEMRDGQMRFIDRSHATHVDVALSDIEVRAEGLRTQKDGEDMPASVQLTGTTTGGGKVTVRIQADPLALPPRFTTTMEVKEQALPPLNSLLQAYADADVATGQFEFFLEATAKDGGYSGYTKPFFKDIDFTSPSDRKDPLIERVVEKAANAVTSLLENEEDKVASKAPFSGTFDQNTVDVWTAVSTLLRNAFVQALREGFDGLRGGNKDDEK